MAISIVCIYVGSNQMSLTVTLISEFGENVSRLRYRVFWMRVVNLWENVSSCTTNIWEIFDHRSHIFLISAKLSFNGPLVCSTICYVLIVLHTRGWWKFSFSDIKKKLQEWSMVKKLSFVSCAAWNVFPINSLLSSKIPCTLTLVRYI